MEENQNVTEQNFNQNFEAKPTKSVKTNWLLIACIVLVVIAIALFGMMKYTGIFAKGDKLYKSYIEKYIGEVNKNLKSMNFDTSKSSVKLDMDIDSDNSELKDAVEFINNTEVELQTQLDTQQKLLLVKLYSQYNKEDLLNAEVFFDVNKEKSYMRLKNLLDKTFEIDNMKEDSFSEFSEALDNLNKTYSEEKSMKKAMKILGEELKNIVKKQYCTVKSEKITVDGKEIKATKNTLKMSYSDLTDELTKVIENLKNNKDFLNCYEDKDEIEELLDDLLDDMDDASTSLDYDNFEIEIALYTKGIFNNIVKGYVSFISDDDEIMAINVVPTEKDTVEFEVSVKDSDEKLKGSIKTEEKDKTDQIITTSLNVPELGKIKMNIELSQKYNEKIDTFDTDNSVKMNELTEEDQNELLQKLEKSKLYELIKKYSSSKNTLSGFSDDDYNYNLNINDDYSYNKSTETSDNEIISYDNKKKITYKIPAGYKVLATSDNYKTLEKGYGEITIKTDYCPNGYYEKLEDSKKYYIESNYGNVNLSEQASVEVNGNTFYYATLSYEYTDSPSLGKFEKQHYWMQISDDYYLSITIDNEDNQITNSEIREILEMQITNN